MLSFVFFYVERERSLVTKYFEHEFFPIKRAWGILFTNGEVASYEVKYLCDGPMDAIFSETVSDEIAKTRKEKCQCDCKVDYPSQRTHECLMLTLHVGQRTA